MIGDQDRSQQSENIPCVDVVLLLCVQILTLHVGRNEVNHLQIGKKSHHLFYT